MLRRKRTLVALVLAICGAGALVGGAGMAEDDDGVRFVGTTTVAGSDIGWAVDDRALVGAADDVFVGRVLRAEDRLTTTETSAPPMPESQFAVDVLRNMKGGLSGEVTVNQAGGYVEYSADRDYPEHGIQEGDRVRQLSLYNDVPLLEPGQEYLFVTYYDRENGWHEMVSPHLAKLKLKDEAQRRALIGRFEKAKQEQRDPFSPSEKPGEEPTAR